MITNLLLLALMVVGFGLMAIIGMAVDYFLK